MGLHQIPGKGVPVFSVGMMGRICYSGVTLWSDLPPIGNAIASISRHDLCLIIAVNDEFAFVVTKNGRLGWVRLGYIVNPDRQAIR